MFSRSLSQKTIVYTLAECLRPVAIMFGESINQFYKAVSNNLWFFEYIPILVAFYLAMFVIVVGLLVALVILLWYCGQGMYSRFFGGGGTSKGTTNKSTKYISNLAEDYAGQVINKGNKKQENSEDSNSVVPDDTKLSSNESKESTTTIHQRAVPTKLNKESDDNGSESDKKVDTIAIREDNLKLKLT